MEVVKFILFFLVMVVVTVGATDSEVRNPLRKRKPQQEQRQRQPVQQEKDAVSESITCPEEFGFFADAEQCDKYYTCENSVPTAKLCPDGLVFLEAGSSIEKCEFPFAVDCSGRSVLQPPQPGLNCPRKNGYFAHEDVKICDKFFFCVDGAYNAITCPAGLVFSNATGTCTWPDQAKKAHCSSGELFEFDCPKVGVPVEGETVNPHPRYADPKDCQSFYVCIDGKVPRKGGCSLGQVFNEKSGQCDKPKNVPECKDWYKGILDYDEEGDILTTTTKPRRPASSNSAGKRKGPKRPVVINEE
ncbi:protein obstructor-E [Folsomia candida]|uniref:protein obstructor-E n=1 Tax=Folsomia candida TaxID=158441 RepID=UPI000B8EFA02|nr:protein obstructor-E [Folsomia candida]